MTMPNESEERGRRGGIAKGQAAFESDNRVTGFVKSRGSLDSNRGLFHLRRVRGTQIGAQVADCVGEIGARLSQLRHIIFTLRHTP
jgi:hypothetical protein